MHTITLHHTHTYTHKHTHTHACTHRYTHTNTHTHASSSYIQTHNKSSHFNPARRMPRYCDWLCTCIYICPCSTCTSGGYLKFVLLIIAINHHCYYSVSVQDQYKCAIAKWDRSLKIYRQGDNAPADIWLC